MMTNAMVISSGAMPEAERVDARWLHGALGLAKMFPHWIEQWENKVVFTPALQGKREISGIKGCAGQNRKDYTLSTRDALKIAMATDTPKAVGVRDMLIDKLESAAKLGAAIRTAQAPMLPPNYLSALKCLVASEEAKIALADENNALRAEIRRLRRKKPVYDVSPVHHLLETRLDWETRIIRQNWKRETCTTILKKCGMENPTHGDARKAAYYIRKRLGIDRAPKVSTAGARFYPCPPLNTAYISAKDAI